jgi:hypothetical protein
MAATQRTAGSKNSVELSNLFRKKMSVVPISAMPQGEMLVRDN